MIHRTSRWRDLVPPLVLLLALAAIGGVAYLTRHPESPALARAADWPGVGPLVDRFRAAYRPAPAVPRDAAPADEADAMDGATGPASADVAVFAGHRPPTSVAGALPTVWVLAGTAVLAAPETAAARRGEIPTIANLPVFERRGDWFRVYRRGLEGWVHLPGYDDRAAPLGREPDPVLPLQPRPPDPAALAAARSHLDGEVGEEGRLGPYALYTDVADRPLLARLDRLAGGLDAVYRERYGLTPQGEPQAAIVLLRDEASYRALQAASERIAGLTASGHSTPGLALLFRGTRSDDEVAGTLVHELVHLINRRALGPALPSWIDEGLADDLALAAVDDGPLDPSRLSGTGVRDAEGRVIFHGGKAALFTLRDGLRDRTVPPVPELLALDWESFVRSDNSRLHYAAAALFVRWLLDGEGGRRRDAFRAFLGDVAAGGPATPEALQRVLGQPWPVIDALFRAWTDGVAESLLVEFGTKRYGLVFTDAAG